MSESQKMPPDMPAVACNGSTWGRCAALGWALRRASEAETAAERYEKLVADITEYLPHEATYRESVAAAGRRLKELEAQIATWTRPRTLKPWEYVEADGRIHVLPYMSPPTPAQLSGCPACGSDASTTRGLKKEEIERGRRVCSRCYTRYER